jgi:type II secretory pathway pseudopilin PulG
MPQQVQNRRLVRTGRRSERGYILLMLMLFVTLLAIAAAVAAPTIAFEIRRDREEEMIHRGVQYSRAIKRYVKKTGRFPSRIEDLENTNNIRFLRKRYKDPVTNKDFKLLHIGDVQLSGLGGVAGASFGGGAIPGASAIGGQAGGAMAQGAALMAAAGAASSMMGSNPNSAAGAAGNANAAGDNSGQDSGQTKDSSADSAAAGQSPGGAGQNAAGGDKLSSQVFGGGPIVGVSSISKNQSIREFNHKNHYDKWQFIYDPSMDRGGLITTPAQPALQVTAPLQQNQNGQGQNPSPSSSGSSGFSMSPQSPPPAQPTQQPQ